MRNLILTAVALAAAAAPGQVPAQPSPPRWKLAEGDQLQWTFRQSTETETGVLGSDKPNIRVTVEMTIESRWLVEEAGADGFSIRQTIQSMRLKMNAPPGDPVVYDSATDEPPETGAAAELAAKLGPLVGAEIKIAMSPLGKITAAELADPYNQALAAADPEMLGQMLGSSLLPLPDDGERADGKWQDEATLQTALGKLTKRREFRLRPPDGDTVAIQMEGDLSLQPAPREDGAVVRLRSHQLSGHYRFNHQQGHLESAEVSQTTFTDTTYRDSRVAVRAKSKLSTEVRRP